MSPAMLLDRGLGPGRVLFKAAFANVVTRVDFHKDDRIPEGRKPL